MPEFAPAVPRFFPEASFTQQDILRLFDRLLPDYYIEPLKSPGPGYEYLQAVAKMVARLSEAAAHMATGSYVGSATGGKRAYATVEISRDNSVFGEVTLLRGTLVGTDDGYLYQTLTDITFGATEIGAKLVEVEATARGWDWNKPGPITSAGGESVVGSITRLVSAVVPTTGVFDPTFQVRQVSPTSVTPHTLSAAIVQPAVGSVLRLDLNTVQDKPRAGATLYIGTSIEARDEYLVEAVISTSPFQSRVKLISAGLNATGTTIPVGTNVYVTSDAYGGESMMLDGLGFDKGVFRNNTFARVEIERALVDVEITLMPGTRVGTFTGYQYQLLDSVNFPANSTAPQYARAIPVVLPDEYAAQGEIDSLTLPKWGSQSVPLPDITVTQVQAYTQEEDEAYRARIALLPYVVTPNSVQHLLEQLVGTWIKRAGQTYSWREIWDIRFQTAYDMPINQTFTQAEVGVPVPAYSANIFVYDFEPDDAISNRYLAPERGMIVFGLPEIAGLEAAYAGLAAALDGATPAGISLGYILT
jgi:hypothetical protein